METLKENQSAFGIYRNSREMERAIRALRHVGFKASDISALVPPTAQEGGTPDLPDSERRQVFKFARIGLLAGFIVWAVVSILVAADVLPMTFIETLPTLGKVMSVVAASLAGALVGAAAGALVGVGTPKPAGERYENYVKSGGILLSVHVENERETTQAKEVLEKTGGVDITSMDEVRGWRPILIHNAIVSG